MRTAAPVCTVGWDIVENLLPDADPIGKEIRVDGEACQVIGVGKKLGSALGQSRDNWVIMPITLALRRYGANETIRIWGKAQGTEHLQETIDEVRQILRARRHLAYGAKDDFAVETSQSFLSLWAGISSAFFGVVVAIASISLVVGGIVIMNIMLVSVTERTREIGVRKAIGAKRRNILWQFLLEAATLAGVGGVIGVLVGSALGLAVRLIFPSLPASISVFWSIVGLATSAIIGIGFGMYPAWKAAKLNPVEALRYE
jgi:putative ABC transport system permease protein